MEVTGAESCEVTWYYNGKPIKPSDKFKLEAAGEHTLVSGFKPCSHIAKFSLIFSPKFITTIPSVFCIIEKNFGLNGLWTHLARNSILKYKIISVGISATG